MVNKISKADVVWYEEEEYVALEDKEGWKILLVANHFRHKFWYDIETPDGYTLGLIEQNIYKAIDKLDEVRENYGVWEKEK